MAYSPSNPSSALSSSGKGRQLTILGIETSCDETAAAIVRRRPDGGGHILSNLVRSQFSDHAGFGGVVPEIAARSHAVFLDGLIERALEEAHLKFEDLDGVAATAGPGLIGGLLVGLVTAKAIALVQNLPLVAVNHLEGHALTIGLTDGIEPPYLLLLVSGGHSEFIAVNGGMSYDKLGGTVDDALGEAFDKVAKFLGLGFPGGPAVERHAKLGDPERFAFPRPMLGRPGADFSFSGLKTAVRMEALKCAPLTDEDVADLCASFQSAAAATVRDRTRAAMRLWTGSANRFVVAGGVASNTVIKQALTDECAANGFSFHAPPPNLCTDNAAMIAWAGACRLGWGHRDPFDVAARPRWPLGQRLPSSEGKASAKYPLSTAQ